MRNVSLLRMRLQATVACFGGLMLWWKFGGNAWILLAVFVSSLALVAWFAPGRYAPVQRGFDLLTRLVVTGVSWLLLGLVYFGLFMPLRLLGELLGRDPLELKHADGKASFLKPLPSAVTDRFKRQY